MRMRERAVAVSIPDPVDWKTLVLDAVEGADPEQLAAPCYFYASAWFEEVVGWTMPPGVHSSGLPTA